MTTSKPPSRHQFVELGEPMERLTALAPLRQLHLTKRLGYKHRVELFAQLVELLATGPRLRAYRLIISAGRPLSIAKSSKARPAASAFVTT